MKTIRQEELKKIRMFSRWFEKYFDNDYNKLEQCLKAYNLAKNHINWRELVEIFAIDSFGSVKDKEELKVRLGLVKEVNPLVELLVEE